MSSSISQPFTVTVIPKQVFPAPILISPQSLVPNANTLDISISKYSVLKYLINPTPKLIHSTPITSDEIFTAFCAPSFGFQRADKKCYFHVDSDHEVLVPAPVISCHTLGAQTTVAVLQDGTILTYQKTGSSELKEEKRTKIPYRHILKAFFIDGNYLLVISQESVSLFDLNTMTELATRTNISTENSEFKLFKGKLYRYDVKHSYFEIFNVINLEDVHSLKIPFMKKGDVVTFSPIEDMKVILSRNNVAFLLDLSLGSVITTTTFEHLKWFRILDGVEDTFAIGVSCTLSSGELKLEVLNLELDTNGSTLKSALGRGMINYVPDRLSNGTHDLKLFLKPLLADNNKNETAQDSKVDGMANGEAFDKVEEGSSKLKEKQNPLPETIDFRRILKKLKNKVGSAESFDLSFFDSLNIKHEYYTENDRAIINQDFLRDVIDLIFQNFTFNENEPYPKAMTYLLTHPFFPRDKAKNLLATLRGNPHLYKQAVVTCPNIPLEELLTELFSIENNELSLDISLRVLEDFTKDDIKEKLKLLPKVDVERFIEFIIQTDSNYNQDTTSESVTAVGNGNSNIVAKINNYPRATTYVFELLSLVIDSVGLLSLEGKLLDDLTAFINRKVEVAAENSELHHMLDYRTSICNDTPAHSSYKLKKYKGKRVIPPYTVEYLNV